jgi:pimeloyl-ACP methyl ester carboxylesterase
VIAPLADEILTLADGRLLAWAEWGDPRGLPVVLLHPSPGSRLLCPDFGATVAAGVRLITVDRPGYGRSDPVPDPTLAGFAHDLERLLDHLWLGQIRVVGWSGGGPYAAACAAILADRVIAVALLATPAPDSYLRCFTPPLPMVTQPGDGGTPPVLAGAADLEGYLAAAAERAGDGWDSPSDTVARSQPAVKRALAAMWGESFRAGAGGLAADVVAGSRSWGFVPIQVRAPVALFYGQDDAVIEPAEGRWWAQALPRAELTVCPGTGHLVPFAAWAEVLRGLPRP